MEGLTTNGLIAACLVILIGIVINRLWAVWTLRKNHKGNGPPGNPEYPMREDCRTMFYDIKTELSQIQMNTLRYGDKIDDIQNRVGNIETKLGVKKRR